MAIYIKGMSIPDEKKESELLIVTSRGKCLDMKDNSYEVVEVPEPHGELVDIRPLMRGLYEEIMTGGDEYTSESVYDMLNEELNVVVPPSE